MAWHHHPIIAFDTETTGLSPKNGDRVIEFAAVIYHLSHRMEVLEEGYVSHLFSVGRPLPRLITRITGITDKMLVGAPRFEEHAAEIHRLLGTGIIVAHNIGFDKQFLTSEFQRVGLDWPQPVAEIDTLRLSRASYPGISGHRLSDLATRLGVRLDGAHRAGADARACGEVFLALARRAALQSEEPEEVEAWASGRALA
ncbi:MAG: 3'-5' exonuclease [Deltaproteobacteria bacterium]|nr:3'-5' exonuclease [Deltaproteobacteria bacterium]